MPRLLRATGPQIRLVIVSLAAAALAGCVGPDVTPTDPFADAMAAPGEVYTPERRSGDTAFRVKLLEPLDPTDAPKALAPLRVLVYDATTMTAVQDAVVILESWMVEHDHGTAGESDPVHTGGGVYEGETFHSMEGPWEVRLDGVRPNGDAFWLTIPFTVR